MDTSASGSATSIPELDAVVVGAGMAGLYMLHRLRQLGFTARVFEKGNDVGGTWYWNRYPGARCDVQSIDYSYSFDPDLEAEWQWSEKYATQPEILSYLQHVADRFDLRRDITFGTTVVSARWDDAKSVWQLHTSEDEAVTCRYYIAATGCLSVPKPIEIEGLGQFAGEVYHTSRWPQEKVDFSGKRVAVIGTGSSGIQVIPIIARQAAQLTVFQRTPNYSVPAGNGPVPHWKLAEYQGREAAYREAARWSLVGWPIEAASEGALDLTPEERARRYEDAWARGELVAQARAANDIGTNATANETYATFIRNKIRAAVHDPEIAEALCPKDYPFGTKRPCLDTGYYEAFNLPHVRLVDLRNNPISTFTPSAIETSAETFELDATVFATGFDAMTGALVAVDITGRADLTLAEKWRDGPHTYLGLMSVGFPNLFMVTGPGSPSVLSNMAVSIEQHVDWISDCLVDLRDHGYDVIEPTEQAEIAWVKHVNEVAKFTLFPKANSWYMGANVPGKARVFLPYAGGVGAYRTICDEVASGNYFGFTRSGPAGSVCYDGVVR